MSIPYVTGPCHIYVGLGGATPPFSGAVGANVGTTPAYLGTCESAPRIQFNPGWEKVMNDISGSQKAYDWLYEGKDAQVFGDLTVWNWYVLNQCMDRMSAGGDNAAATGGTDVPEATGLLMITEGRAYNVWIQFPYSTKAAFTTGKMVAGYRFLAGWLLGPDEVDPGTKANKIHIQFQCNRIRDAAGNQKLYDHNMSALPATVPTTATGV